MATFPTHYSQESKAILSLHISFCESSSSASLFPKLSTISAGIVDEVGTRWLMLCASLETFGKNFHLNSCQVIKKGKINRGIFSFQKSRRICKGQLALIDVKCYKQQQLILTMSCEVGKYSAILRRGKTQFECLAQGHTSEWWSGALEPRSPCAQTTRVCCILPYTE